MDQHNSDNWKQQLQAMGFTEDDIFRADQAAVTSVLHAVDWLQSNPSPSPIDTSQQWPSVPETLQPPDHSDPSLLQSSSNHHLQHAHPREQENQAKLSSTNFIPPPLSENVPLVAAEGIIIQPEDDLQRAMDISREEQDQRDMERALLMSKQEDSVRQSTDQDPYLRRALEESLRDKDRVNNQDSSWHSQVFANPWERVRKHLNDPVGLRNIGNTCYLNSLLQVYYNLPNFRRAIMLFRAPDCYEAVPITDAMEGGVQSGKGTTDPTQESCDLEPLPSQQNCSGQDNETLDSTDIPINVLSQETIRRNSVEFVVELQKLFATMALGNQNCADPTAVTRAMRDDNGKPIVIGAQRDASEFNQIFLDIIEKGLGTCRYAPTIEPKDHGIANCKQEEASQFQARSENFVKDMFTMKFRQEIWRGFGNDIRDTLSSDTPITTNCETTSIIVDATTPHERNLHGGLEDFVRTQIRYLDGGGSEEENANDSSERENEQTNNQHTINARDGSREDAYIALKTVWFTHLPPVIVVYLQRGSYNRDTLRAEKVHDRYEFPTRLDLDRYLEENREIAEAARKEIYEIRRERARILNILEQYKRFPLECTRMEDGDSTPPNAYDKEKLVLQSADIEREDFFEAGARIQKRLREALQPPSSLHFISGLSSERIESSLDTIGKVLDYDRERCSELEAQLKSIRSESDVHRGLDNVSYYLHAVLVHDGAPDSGHYWAFINNQKFRNESEMWMKLSDSNVKLVSETEMLSWSLGGNGKASAYCLMYTAANDTQTCPSVAQESSTLLPQQILLEVSEASAQFEKELEVAGKGEASQHSEEAKVLATPERTEED